MTKDPFERYNTKPEYFLKGESEPASLQRIDARIDSFRRGNPKPPLLRWLTIGAAAIFLAFLINDVFFQPEAEILAQTFFEPMPNYVTSQQRGGDLSGDEVYQLYENGEFGAFTNALQENGDMSSIDSLYLAVGFVALQDWNKALIALDDLETSLPPDYRPSYKWYQTLALLGDGRTEDAMSNLEDLRSGSSSYADEAGELYEALQ